MLQVSADFKSKNGICEIAETEKRGFEYGVVHWRSKVEGPLLDLLEQSLELPKNELLSLLDLGAIYDHQQRLIDSSALTKICAAGTYLRIHSKPRRFPTDFEWGQRLIDVRPEFVVVNKPAGIPCHPTVDNLKENLLNTLSGYLGHPLYITHRLDVGTSGLIVLAKTKNFQTHFNSMLKTGAVKKNYRTLVDGLPAWAPGTVFRHWLMPSPRAPKVMSPDPTLGWAECLLKIAHCQSDLTTARSVVELELLTGRTHQIRAQMAALGHPLTGDLIYGGSPSQNSFSLQSHSLEFEDSGHGRIYKLSEPLI